ncbi:hypothetical protein MKX01_022636 [Papaver californicum]|nr:hypothetical protein MKX01_022636 [Papaver californicum]
MAKLRDREADSSDTSSDDFEKVQKKKMKLDSQNHLKIVEKHTLKLFRANFGALHDLFRDIDQMGHKLNHEQLAALKSTLFWSMLEVFIDNIISKEELAKKNHACSRVFVSTPLDMAIIFGLQLIENGIENKLLYECKKYNFGEEKSTVIRSTKVQASILDALSNEEVKDLMRLIDFYILPCNYLVFVKSIDVIKRISWPHMIHNAMMESIDSSDGMLIVSPDAVSIFIGFGWFAEHSFLVDKRKGAETNIPRFARWDARKISKAISPLDWVNEKNLITPIDNNQGGKKLEIRAMNLEKENVALILEKEDGLSKLREIQMKLRSEKNRLRAKGKRKKVNHDELSQGREAPQDEDDETHEEYGWQTPETVPQVPHLENASSGPVFSLGLTQFFNEAETSAQLHYHDLAELEKPKKGPKMKGISEEKDFAWRVLDNDRVDTITVLGLHIQDLLDYKLKEAESQMQSSQDIPKYSKSAFMQPEVFVHVQSVDTDEIRKHVQEFILDIPDGVFDLFVPIYRRSVSHLGTSPLQLL